MSQRRLFDMLLRCPVLPYPVDLPPVIQKFVRRLHRHTTEVGDKVSAVCVACNVTFRTLSSILSTKRQHITAVTTPVGTQVCEWFETVRNPVVDLFLVSVLKTQSAYDSGRRTYALTPVLDLDIHFVTTFS